MNEHLPGSNGAIVMLYIKFVLSACHNEFVARICLHYTWILAIWKLNPHLPAISRRFHISLIWCSKRIIHSNFELSTLTATWY